MERIDMFHLFTSDFSSDLEQGMARMVVVSSGHGIILKKVEGEYMPIVWQQSRD